MMKVFLLFLLIPPTISGQTTPLNPCQDNYTHLFPGGCFMFIDKVANYSQAVQTCAQNYGSLVTILSDSDENAVLTEASYKFGSSFTYWLGLSCTGQGGEFAWTEGCPFGYHDFSENEPAIKCATGSEHFIASSDIGTYWVFAPDDATATSIICSHRTDSGCNPHTVRPEDLSIQHATELIILGIALLAVIVLSFAVCGCWAFNGRRKTRAQKKADEARKQRECAAALKEANIDFNIEMGKFKFQVGKPAAAAIGEATAAKALERTPSMRYTPFPRAEGAGEHFDEWEIDRRHVSIDYTTKLGQGAFGSVYLGVVDSSNIPTTEGKSIIEQSALKKDNNAVAIKMLHESADKLQTMQFYEEIELMKRLGYHERLVNMLACASQSEPALLIIEYCVHGDLLNYMRERRQFMLGAPEAMSSIDRSRIITQKQQLMFCVQIAYGLEYLSQKGFVHRDIAARNILVDQHESCKVGDFGLCREIEKQDEHYHSRGGRLPLKWMSPEAIERYDFTIASDVWAFGVLLFEIITLGGNPYPDWPAAEVLSRLKKGRRMDRPDNCTDHMFTVMNSCWKLAPADRPSFSDLRQKMGVALEEVSEDDYYLKLNARAMYYCTQSEIDEDTEIIDEEAEASENMRL